MSFTDCKITALNADPKVYRATDKLRGDTQLPISSSTLREIAWCAARWRNGYSSPDTPAKDKGNVFDCQVLTPEHFHDRYAVKPETRKSVDGTKTVRWTDDKRLPEVQEWHAENEGKEVVSVAERQQAFNAGQIIRSKPEIANFLDASDKQVWVSGFYADKETGLRIPVQCLIDLVPRKDTEFYKSLADYKTTRNAGIRPWTSWCFQAGYHIQAAWDTDLYVAATGEDRCSWSWLVQENYPPYQCGWRIAGQDFIDLGRQQYQWMLACYCRYLKTNFWPAYEEVLPEEDTVQGAAIIKAENWMREKAFAQMYGDLRESQHIPDPEMPELPAADAIRESREEWDAEDITP